MKNAITAVILLSLLVLSCTSAPPATGMPEGESVEFVREDGATRMLLRLNEDSRTVLEGWAEQNDDGSWIVQADSLHWFNNWAQGWTEADIAVTGMLLVSETDEGWHIRAQETVRADYAEKGAIRYRDSRLGGDAGRDACTRRLNRISAAVAHLSEKLHGEPFPYFTHEKKKLRRKSFEYRAGAILFPEQYGYPAGTEKKSGKKVTRIRGEGVLWNMEYTAEHIPENLREIRNAGTLYRDWEESGELFYYLYVLENLNE